MQGMNKDIKQLASKAKKQGWVVETTGGGHLRWTSPEGKSVISGNTVSDYRAVRNISKRLERAGLPSGKPRKKKVSY
jgi:hypothetical protein